MLQTLSLAVMVALFHAALLPHVLHLCVVTVSAAVSTRTRALKARVTGIWQTLVSITRRIVNAVMRVINTVRRIIQRLIDLKNKAELFIKALPSRIATLLRDGAVLLAFLIFEVVRGLLTDADDEEDIEEESENDEQQEDHTSQAARRYAAACALLGLAEQCDRDALVKAYRRAMSTAHPDRGGSTKQAQAINKARARIARHNGWKI